MPNPENPLPNRHWIERCVNCGYAKTYIEDQHRTECSYCGKKESFKNYEIAIPLAFRTDLSPGKDAREDEDVFFSVSSSGSCTYLTEYFLYYLIKSSSWGSDGVQS